VVEPVRYGYELPYVDPEAPTDQERYEQEMSDILDRAVESAPAGIVAERRRMSGDPAKLIAQAAEDFDLLVVGSRGYGPIRRTLVGGVAAKVMQIAPCPVLVLPRGAGTDPLGLREVEGDVPVPR
jgi:nucleotide-binding universal stress UspA family protein